ncbi:MAG: LemA family protein [Alphaproteobacteria bacterium]
MTYMLVFIVVLGVMAVTIYNGLINAYQRVREAWSTVETQLKRRYDLVPNLVETVRGYAKHEADTLADVVSARNMAKRTSDVAQLAKDENILTDALKSVFALSENYPDLKASNNFLELQQELADIETKIQASRQFYNTMVLSFNTRIKMFPGNLFAAVFHFTPEQFFELKEDEKQQVYQTPKISF